MHIKNIINKVNNSYIFDTLMHSKNYLSADIAIHALALISLPVFTRLLTKADFGTYEVFLANVSIFSIIFSLNSHSAVNRYYFEEKKDFPEFVGSTLVFTGGIFLILSLLYLLFYKSINRFLNLPGHTYFFLLVACMFTILYSIYQQILVPKKKSKEFAVLSIFKNYSMFGFAVLFILLIRNELYRGRIWALLLVNFLIALYIIKKLFKYAKISFKKDHIRYIVTYSFPLIPSALSALILAQFDRIMINNTIDAASAGLYSLGYTFGMLLLIVINALQRASGPDIIRFLLNKDYSKFNYLTSQIFSMTCFAALGLVLFAKEMFIILVDPKFYPSQEVVPMVVIGAIFYAMYAIYNKYPGLRKKTGYISFVVLASGILNIVLNTIYIPRYGFIAAAYTTAVSYFVMFLLGWICSKFFMKEITFPLWMLWKPTLILFAFIIIWHLLNSLTLGFFIFLIMKIMLLASFGSILFFKELRFFYRELRT